MFVNISKLIATRSGYASQYKRVTCDILHKRHYKMSVAAVKKGQIVQYQNGPWKVLARDHSSTGRGGAVIKVDLENIITQAKVSERFKSGSSVEILNLQHETYQFLYEDSGLIHLLEPETFEELEMKAENCEGGVTVAEMMEEGMPISVSFLTTPEDGRQPIAFKLPAKHTFEVGSVVARAGQAKGTVFQSATLTNGAKIDVPEFVKEGDRILIDLETMKYLKREL
ncbi:hypothetical protein DFQ28_010363 [Apophysomyces sp. BC1034]|nr:hypothetical protein DFQ30_010017 [Apophysomyces sp. BC1015]KAG0171346.1 hypothetical protein DFQ29_008889 [Apophysomyces sp. BC1021]KAG0184837.1 hypothetical protein DFQ28_010363 [Apophysomyces sp. BC1034]